MPDQRPRAPDDQVRAALDALPCAVAILGLENGIFLFANQAFTQLLDYRHDQLLGQPVSALGLCSASKASRVRDEALGELGRRNIPVQLTSQTGSTVETLATVARLEFAGSECALVTLIDITPWQTAERELRTREEQVRVAVELSQAGIGLVGKDGRYTFANQRLAEMFGFEPSEFIGTFYVDHLHPEARSVGGERLHALTSGEVDRVVTERHYVRKDGSDFWGLLSSRRQNDADGNLVALVGVIADITQRKQSEAALRSSEERFRTLVDLAADAILQGDPAGVIIGANVTAATLTAYGPDELVGMNISSLFDVSEQVRKPLRYDLLKRGEVVRTERNLRRKDGSLVPVEMNTKMMPDASYQTLIRDVSARKLAEGILRASEEKFALAFNHAPLLMAIARIPDGLLLDVNEQFCAVSGFSRDEAVGKTALELGWTNPKDVQRVQAELGRTSSVHEARRVFTCKDGREIQGLYRSERVTIGGQTCILSTVVDITEKLRMEEELARAQKLESLGVLAGGIAHDFNNLLTGILGNLSLAHELVGEAHEATSSLQDCEKAAMRAAELTRQLLTFARGGAPNRRAVDMGRLVRDVVPFVLRGSNVRGTIDSPPDLWLIDADEGQIGQVLSNLLINAKQAMPAGGNVVVRAENVLVAEAEPQLKAGRYVRIAVQDSGTGIAPSILGKIFDPYFTTKPGGSGLGLASVYSIVRRHDGSVRASSDSSQGATFVVWLPASSAPREATATGQAPAKLQSAAATRVLVMDDDELIRRVAAAMLHQLGYTTVVCADGAAAVERYGAAMAAGEPFSCVLLDLTVPGGMGGLEAAKHIHALDPQATLVVSSGYSNDAVLADCQASGFAGAVGKPYTVQALARELTRVLAPKLQVSTLAPAGDVSR